MVNIFREERIKDGTVLAMQLVPPKTLKSVLCRPQLSSLLLIKPTDEVADELFNVLDAEYCSAVASYPGVTADRLPKCVLQKLWKRLGVLAVAKRKA